MSVYAACWAGTLICDEMKDADIVALIKRLGLLKACPLWSTPAFWSPRHSSMKLLSSACPTRSCRTPAAYRYDTSQKVGIRFGETIRAMLLKAAI